MILSNLISFLDFFISINLVTYVFGKPVYISYNFRNTLYSYGFTQAANGMKASGLVSK